VFLDTVTEENFECVLLCVDCAVGDGCDSEWC